MVYQHVRQSVQSIYKYFTRTMPRVGPGHPSSPLVHLLPHLFPLFTFLFLSLAFTYFLLLSIPSLSTRIVPLHFQARGRRSRPNLGLVCVLLSNLCYLYSVIKMDCGVLFYLVPRVGPGCVLCTRIDPLHFQERGLVCVLLCNLCYLYSLVKVDCVVLFYLV